jgi:AcrR family transcriptional regulator
MTTEEKIFNAARSVFQQKGYAGARMQEIADEAGINKAMLHYFFRSKEQLFKAVFLNAFYQIAPQMNEIFNSSDSLFIKIEKFTENYISFVKKNRFLPAFIIQEMNNNPQFVKEVLSNEARPNPAKLIKQVQEEMEKGIIKTMNPKQLLLDIFSMTVFPFAAQTLVKGILEISDEEFEIFLEERKKHITEQIINAIKR